MRLPRGCRVPRGMLGMLGVGATTASAQHRAGTCVRASPGTWRAPACSHPAQLTCYRDGPGGTRRPLLPPMPVGATRQATWKHHACRGEAHCCPGPRSGPRLLRCCPCCGIKGGGVGCCNMRASAQPRLVVALANGRPCGRCPPAWRPGVEALAYLAFVSDIPAKLAASQGQRAARAAAPLYCRPSPSRRLRCELAQATINTNK